MDVDISRPTDDDDAVRDAVTECVAARVGRDAGILTPRLIAFDNSRKLVDRPFSLWERVHGQTVLLPRDMGVAILLARSSTSFWI
jgi:hypothetical protein